MRYVVWACFGVDAENPEEAKEIIGHVIDTHPLDRIDLCKMYNVNEAIFISPAFDKLIGVTIKKDKKGE